MHIHAKYRKDWMTTEGAYLIWKKGSQANGLTARHRKSSADYVSSGVKSGKICNYSTLSQGNSKQDGQWQRKPWFIRVIFCIAMMDGKYDSDQYIQYIINELFGTGGCFIKLDIRCKFTKILITTFDSYCFYAKQKGYRTCRDNLG